MKTPSLIHRQPASRLTPALLTVSLMLAAGCAPNEGKEPGVVSAPEVQKTPPTGATSFVSADGHNGQATQENTDNASNNTAEPGFAGEADGARDDRTVEEGDIYQVAGDSQHIFNLNSYRGFQIINIADPTNPQITGAVRLGGTPVEMYQVGDRVFVLLNNWRSYWRSRHASALPEAYQGGGVVVIDISDKSNPQITARAQVPGWISTSRMTRGNNKEALFVVASEYNGGGQTNVKSFSVDAQGKLQVATELSLGGSIQDIQGTPDYLIVARYDNANQGQNNWAQSLVSLIDITSPEGVMVEGPQVKVSGRVQNKFNMDVQGDILRVVSGNSWGASGNTNHVETFKIQADNTLSPVDHKTFGDNEDLYATLFMEDRAFFVTYRRVDPFHAFSVSPTGQLEEKSEFIVSGWNDFFKPVANRTRLIGIGKNDENGSTMAVSLYDVTDLTNPSPMITRAEVDLTHSWSEAQWDDRAFSVLEKATSVTAPDGTLETGLVLLPFSGWDEQAKEYVSKVQIYTFSNSTLTLRGTMDHGTRVRRSFLARRSEDLTANLSEAELSLFTTTDADNPVEQGRAELAPNFAGFHIFGSHGLRLHDRSGYYDWWGSRSANTQRHDSLQVVPLADASGQPVDVDRAAAVAEIQVPAHAQTYKVGDRLVALSTSATDNTKADVQVWNLSNPASPSLEATAQASDLPLYNYYGGYYDCFDCYYYGGNTKSGKVVGDALVFPSYESHQELLGSERRRTLYPTDSNYRWGGQCYTYDDQGNYQTQACTYHQGSYTCTQLTRPDGTKDAEVCSGQLFTCAQDSAGERSCTPVEPTAIPTRERVYTRDRYRYWSSLKLDVLDLSNPAAPTQRARVTMPASDAYAGMVIDGDDVIVSHREPVRVPGDSRPYVRNYFKRIDLSNPASPQVSAKVNVPGPVIAATGDTVLTRDTLWGQKIVETSINKLTVSNGLAYLQGTYRFTDQQVQSVALDGAGHALVGHYNAWRSYYDDYGYSNNDAYDYTKRLTILDLSASTFAPLSTFDVDDWATLKDARPGRALYQVPGGLLVLNITNPAAPEAQAYFPTLGWPQDLTVEGDDLFFSGGRYGMYRFDLSENNLSTP